MTTENITKEILVRFKEITLFDIAGFLSRYVEFSDIHYSNIVNYFSGVSDVSPTESFNSLKNLTADYKVLSDIIVLNSASFDNYEFWILVEYIEDIGGALDSANNASKWLRSAVTKSGYKRQVVSNIVVSQGQKLEDIERDNLKSSNEDDWVETALNNNLREEDYNLDGGSLIKVIYKNNAAFFLNGVVDNIDTPEKTYGLDIDRFIKFENDDLVVLSYRDTFLQSMKVLTDLKRGDDPAFYERGIDVKSIVGGSLAGISYPIVFRQLASNFSTDDGFKSFAITDVKRDKDAVLIEFEIESRAGEVFNDIMQV